jgi:hypothetical protein
MRSLASSLALFSALTLQAQPPNSRTLESIKQAAAVRQDLSCNEVVSASNTRTITVEMIDPTAPRHGTPSSIDTGNLFQDVFAVSSNTDFQWDHWGNLRGKKVAVYRYSNTINGKTHAGLVFADENTGAVSRITFRGTDTTAHLFCTAQSR